MRMAILNFPLISNFMKYYMLSVNQTFNGILEFHVITSCISGENALLLSFAYYYGYDRQIGYI